MAVVCPYSRLCEALEYFPVLYSRETLMMASVINVLGVGCKIYVICL
jgi:hypothetical protein